MSTNLQRDAKEIASMNNAETRVRQLEAERIRTLRDADFGTLSELCHENLVYTHSNGWVDSLDSYLEKCRNATYVYDDIRYDIEHVVIVGDTALVIETIGASFRVNGLQGTFNCRALAVWVRTAETWKFLAYQPTSIPRDDITATGQITQTAE